MPAAPFARVRRRQQLLSGHKVGGVRQRQSLIERGRVRRHERQRSRQVCIKPDSRRISRVIYGRLDASVECQWLWVRSGARVASANSEGQGSVQQQRKRHKNGRGRPHAAAVAQFLRNRPTVTQFLISRPNSVVVKKCQRLPSPIVLDTTPNPNSKLLSANTLLESSTVLLARVLCIQLEQ